MSTFEQHDYPYVFLPFALCPRAHSAACAQVALLQQKLLEAETEIKNSRRTGSAGEAVGNKQEEKGAPNDPFHVQMHVWNDPLWLQVLS